MYQTSPTVMRILDKDCVTKKKIYNNVEVAEDNENNSHKIFSSIQGKKQQNEPTAR